MSRTEEARDAVIAAARAFVIAGDEFADSRPGDELADRRYVQAVANVGIALYELDILTEGGAS